MDSHDAKRAGEVDWLRDKLDQAEADNERLRADRAALLSLWIVEGHGGWQIRGDAFVQFVYATREQAEGSVLAWAHSISDAREAGWDFGPGEA